MRRFQFVFTQQKPVMRFWNRLMAVLSSAFSVLIAAWLLILLWPLIGALIAIVLGVILAVILIGGIWWLFYGRKLVRQMKQRLNEMAGGDPCDDDARPRRHVDVHIRDED